MTETYYFITLDKNNFYQSHTEEDKYKTWQSGILRLESIPEFKTNKFYKYENNNWIEYDSYPIIEEISLIQVPQTITPLQAKLQLLEMELLDEVDEIVATDRKVQLYWEYALVIERNNDILLTMAEMLNLSPEQLDDMFIKASKL